MHYEVEKARRDLYNLLETNPELREYQSTLNKAMNEGSFENRLNVLKTFLQLNLADLQYELINLKNKINEGND